MKVCHVISGDLWAGAEVMDYHLLKGLSKFHDLELSVILFNDGKLAGEIRRIGIPVEVVDEKRYGFLGLLRQVRKRLARLRPDILHSHRLKENIAACLSTGNGIPAQLVCTQHGMPEPLAKGRARYRILRKVHFLVRSRRFRYVVAVSEDIRNRFVREDGFPGDKILVIHNGTEIPDAHPADDRREHFTIGSMGRFFPIKDYPLMVEIAKSVAGSRCEIRFELAGDGPEEGRIRDLVREHGLQNVFTMKGFVDDTTSFYRGLDLYLNTSVSEGISMSALEAMSHGIPVVAPDAGGFGEMIEDGVQGYLVKDRTPEAFAEKCLALYRDKALRNRMGEAARKRILEEFSNDGMAGRYHRLYLEMTGDPADRLGGATENG